MTSYERLKAALDHKKPGWHFLIIDENPAVTLHLTESPAGRRRYYPQPEDPICPDPFTKWDARPVPIGRAKTMDVVGAAVPVPDWNGHARQHADESCFLNYAFCARTEPEQALYTPQEAIKPDSLSVNTPGLWVSRDRMNNQSQLLK